MVELYFFFEFLTQLKSILFVMEFSEIPLINIYLTRKKKKEKG